MINTESVSINPETATVGEIVAQNYHAAGVFRRHGLDFCCGGNITLKSACEKNQLYVDEMIQELLNIPWNQPAADENYMAWQPDYLIDYIEKTHHTFVRSKTDEIAVYAAKVAHVHGERHPENKLIYDHFISLARELMQHMDSEEKRVFPLIKDIYRARVSGKPVGPEETEALQKELELMTAEHEAAGDLMAAIRKLSNNFTPPDDACATYRILYQNLAGFESDLHKHVHLENNILFRKAEKFV